MIPFPPDKPSRSYPGRPGVPLVSGIIIWALLLGFVPEAGALKRAPGRQDTGGRPGPAALAETSSPQQAPGVVPGLFELIPYGVPEVAVKPAWLYGEPGEAVNSEADYFAKRIVVPVEGKFKVPWAVIWVEPRDEGGIAPFPEVLLTGEAPGGGPEMSHPVFRRSGLAPEPGSAELVVDFMDEDTLFRGPQVFYLVVRFPAGASAGAGILLDTDQDYGLYPGTNYLSAGGGPFLGFEQAAGAVRPAFHGLDTWAPPGIAGDQLAMGMFIFTDSLSVPVYPPAVKEITCPEAGDREQGLSVQLEVLPAWSDGRPLDFTPRKIKVTHLLPGSFADSLVSEPDLDQQGRIVIRGLEQRPFLLRFAVLGPDGRPGQPSGAYYVLPSDPDEPNDSRQEAAGLEWAAAASGLWSEARTGPAVVRRAADFDFYRLVLTAGDSLVAGFEGLAGSLSALNPVLSLTDSSGLVLEHDTGAVAEVSLTAPYSGDYYLLVNDRAVFEGEEFTNGAGRVYSLAARLLRRRGDVDGSGGIDYRDAFLVFVMTSGLRDTLSFTPAQRFAADFDGDGLVAGDISDFLGVLYQAGYLPGRDPGRPSKTKAPGPVPASAQTWRLVFADGSSLLLSSGPAVMLETPGEEAGSLLRLLETAGDAQARVKTSRPAALDRPAALGPSFPNPFNPSTTLCFSLKRAGPAELEVFDVRGRLVRSLFRGHAPAGQSSVVWDGTDSRGRQAASGVYFYRLRAEGVTRTRKMLLLK